MLTENAVTQYTCSDGQKFLSRSSAEQYESEYQQVLPILNRIPNTSLRHGTYVTHDLESLKQIKRDLWPLVLMKVNAAENYMTWLGWNPDDVHPLSIVGRVMDDMGGPISVAWRRLAVFCFEIGREFDQPYFVNHQSEAVPHI